MKTRWTMILLSACLMAVAAAGCARIETKPVWYATEPKTPDEQAVAQALEGLITAFNERNFDKWFAYYAPDARIESLAACAVVSREQHRAAVMSTEYLPKAKLDKTRISMVSSDRSRAQAELCLLYSREPDVHRIIYDLIRLDGQWFIREEKLPGEWLWRLGGNRESPVPVLRTGKALREGRHAQRASLFLPTTITLPEKRKPQPAGAPYEMPPMPI